MVNRVFRPYVTKKEEEHRAHHYVSTVNSQHQDQKLSHRAKANLVKTHFLKKGHFKLSLCTAAHNCNDPS